MYSHTFQALTTPMEDPPLPAQDPNKHQKVCFWVSSRKGGVGFHERSQSLSTP